MAFDRSPNFFARSTPYEQSQLLVAEVDKTVVGVGGVALKALRVLGNRLKVAYFYDLRVAPAFRRFGVASAIGDALGTLVRQWKVDLTYSLVLEGNTPSLEFAAKRGLRPVRRCVLAILPACEAEASGQWRSLQEQDLDRLAPLCENSFPRHDLVPTADFERVKEWPTRWPGLSVPACYSLDNGEVLLACFGLWDYSSIMRIRIGRGVAAEPSQHQWLFQAGEIAPHLLLPLAFQGPSLLAEVIGEAQRVLAERQPGPALPALLIPYDPEDRSLTALRQFERFELGVQLFARPIRSDVKLGDRPLYLDPIDL